MKRIRTLVSIALACPHLTATTVGAQNSTPDVVRFLLASPPSQFELGCFEPCKCPILIRSPLIGSFMLQQSGSDPLFTYYDVTDVRWRVADGVQPVEIVGRGTYRRGGEVALEEQLTLDLSFNGGPPMRFDSGLRPSGAPFPEIATRISLHGEYCLDSVLAVDAKPDDPVSAPWSHDQAARLTVAPNPFHVSTEIAFTLPRDAVVDLGVFDIAGRRLRDLAAHEWLPGGSYVRSWDGRLGDQEAPAGLYFLRLDAPWGRTIRPASKLN